MLRRSVEITLQSRWVAPGHGIRVPRSGSDQASTSEGSHPPWKLQRSASIWPRTFFQVHAINGAGEVGVRKALRPAQVLRFFERLAPCLVGIEACGTSHYWAREIRKFGHQVRQIRPAYVKPHVKRGKTDASDAEAIC